MTPTAQRAREYGREKARERFAATDPITESELANLLAIALIEGAIVGTAAALEAFEGSLGKAAS